MHCARLWLGWIHTTTIGEATEDCKWQDLPRPCACVHLWGPRGAPMSPHDNGHVKCLSRPHAQVKRPMLAHSNRNGTTLGAIRPPVPLLWLTRASPPGPFVLASPSRHHAVLLFTSSIFYFTTALSKHLHTVVYRCHIVDFFL